MRYRFLGGLFDRGDHCFSCGLANAPAGVGVDGRRARVLGDGESDGVRNLM